MSEALTTDLVTPASIVAEFSTPIPPDKIWKMNPDLKAKWLEALRSGKYLQAKETLRERIDGPLWGHCCLGVLCDLYNPNGWDRGVSSAWCFEGQDETGELPGNFRDGVANISSAVETRLIRMNDAGMSFAQIADYIEANL